MQAFVDDSSGTRSGNILLLSACIQTYPVWAEFSDAWQAVLDAKPSIKYFHMREARMRKGQFAGWKAVARDLKIIALTDVVMRAEPHVVSSWMDADHYRQFITSVAPSEMRHPYYLSFQSIVQKVAEYQAYLGSTIPVDFVFDKQGDIGNEALFWYAAMKQTAPANVRALMGSTPVFRDDTEVLPLQAADLIAWHKRRRKEIRGRDPEVAATERIDELPGAEVHLTKDFIAEIGRKIAKVPHATEFRDSASMYKKIKHAIRRGRKEI